MAADSLTKESCIAIYLYAKAVKRLYRKEKRVDEEMRASIARYIYKVV